MALGERLLELLGEGSFSATYKHSVLLALIDLCTEKVGERSCTQVQLTTREIAERVIRLYWSHTNPYDKVVLKQNNTDQASILKRIAEHRTYQPVPKHFSADQSSRYDKARWARLVDEIEWKLIQMPLPRLQTIGNRCDTFLYAIRWDLGITKAEVTAYQRSRTGARFDSRLYLRPGVAEGLVRLSPLLKPMIQRNWALLVAKFNRLEVSKLEGFLFGEPRVPVAGAGSFLRDIQGEKCFYCGGRMESQPEVDHFIPWARYPNNALENLVAAHPRCNGHKRDYLASPEHLQRWLKRMQVGTSLRCKLDHFASEADWDTWPARTRHISEAVYIGLPKSYSLWRLGKDFVPLDPKVIAELFRWAEV